MVLTVHEPQILYRKTSQVAIIFGGFLWFIIFFRDFYGGKLAVLPRLNAILHG